MPTEESAQAIDAVMEKLKALQVYMEQTVTDIEAIAAAQLQRLDGTDKAEKAQATWGDFLLGPDAPLKTMKKRLTSMVYMLYRVLQICAEDL